MQHGMTQSCAISSERVGDDQDGRNSILICDDKRDHRWEVRLSNSPVSPPLRQEISLLQSASV